MQKLEEIAVIWHTIFSKKCINWALSNQIDFSIQHPEEKIQTEPIGPLKLVSLLQETKC